MSVNDIVWAALAEEHGLARNELQSEAERLPILSMSRTLTLARPPSIRAM